jgi:hypothetical protein
MIYSAGTRQATRLMFERRIRRQIFATPSVERTGAIQKCEILDQLLPTDGHGLAPS